MLGRKVDRNGDSRHSLHHDSSAGGQSCRGAAPPDQSWESDSSFHDELSRIRGGLLRSELLPHAQALNPGPLSPYPQQSPLTCIWKSSPLRHRNAGTAAIRTAKTSQRFGLGMRVEQACYRGLIGSPKTKSSRRTLPVP